MLKFKNIGELVATFRKDNGMTQEELASKININRASVAKVESSQRAVSLYEAIKISKVFGVSVDTLFSFIENNSIEDDNSFVMAFSSKGIIGKEDLKEVKQIELLVDALYTQEHIYRGE